MAFLPGVDPSPLLFPVPVFLPLPDLALLVGVHRGVGGAGEVPGELGHVGERPTDPVSFGFDA